MAISGPKPLVFLSKRTLLAFSAATFVAACAPESTTADVGGPFKLIDHNGRSVDQTILNGKWSVIFFGFTYCPDICPTTLQTLAEAQKILGSKGKNLQVLLMTVDPERDTPALLKTYLDNSAFPKGTLGLTGTPQQVAEAARAYKMYYKKVGEGEGYTVDHAAMSYLMNTKGKFSRIIGHGTPPDETARIISEAMRRGY